MKLKIEINNLIISELKSLDYTNSYVGCLGDIKQISCIPMNVIVKRIAELELENKHLKIQLSDENIRN